MRSNRFITLAVLAAGSLSALALAACGSGGGATAASSTKTDAATTAAASSTAPTGGASATVDIAHTGLGEILVEAQGRTLYLFKGDAGTKSTCTGACAAAWPPLTVSGKPIAGSNVDADLLGTTSGPSGTQVTYNGHPLYLYAGDTKAGETSGQGITGFGAPWFVLSASGNAVKSTTGASTAAKESSGY